MQSDNDGDPGDRSQQYKQFIGALVDGVVIAGYEVVRQEVKAIGGRAHAFVMLRLNYADYHRQLKRLSESPDEKSRNAHDELAEDMKDYRCRNG